MGYWPVALEGIGSNRFSITQLVSLEILFALIAFLLLEDTLSCYKDMCYKNIEAEISEILRINQRMRLSTEYNFGR